MVKYQNDDIIVHEITTVKSLPVLTVGSFEPQEGDLDKYSEEAKKIILDGTYVWSNGFATSYDKDFHYIVEYLTGDYIGIGVDSKGYIQNKYLQIETPNIEPEIDNGVRGDK